MTRVPQNSGITERARALPDEQFPQAAMQVCVRFRFSMQAMRFLTEVPKQQGEYITAVARGGIRIGKTLSRLKRSNARMLSLRIWSSVQIRCGYSRTFRRSVVRVLPKRLELSIMQNAHELWLQLPAEISRLIQNSVTWSANSRQANLL